MKRKIAALILVPGLALLFAVPVASQQSAGITLYFYRDGQAVPVTRHSNLSGDVQSDATALIAALLEGPAPDEQADGLASPLPAGATLASVSVSGQEVTVDLNLSLAWLRTSLDAYRSDAIVEQIVKTLDPLGLDEVHVRAANESGAFVPVSAFLPRPASAVPDIPPNDDLPPDRPGPAPEYAGQPPAFGQGQPEGALSGKTVWLSSGHGWYWSTTLGRWTTQRGNNYGLVEDLSNAEAVDYYLARYLWNAGADVWLVRERSMTEYEVIVDNDDGPPAYVETGPWATSDSPGYDGRSYRYATTGSSPSATATWTAHLPESGWYAVWAWYRHGTNRPSDARYQIHHAGGVTDVSISQQVHGQTWRYLGEYYFDAGAGARVTLLNESTDTGQAVIADAIRFGGGMGSIPEPGGTSGRPRWEEAASYWAHYQGAPSWVYADDVTARPLYAEWETAKGYPGEAANAVYISWHTNAGGGTGTNSFIHESELPPGSVELQDYVHTELIQDLKAAWNPTWKDRGQKTADFGELRELSNIPGVLLEVAFHDSEDPGDADDLREPLFRQIAARAVYQGIVKYFAARQGPEVHLLPEPPGRLAARTTAPGQVTLTWAPPPCCDGVVGDAATAYKVYQSADGRAFDDGTETGSTRFTLTGLPPGTLAFFHVTALNAGGESFPTPVVAVRTPLAGGWPSLLIVDGFDRLDQAALIPQWESAFLGTDERMFLERMNRYDYAVEHGQALSACGQAFDGAVNEAVSGGDLLLSDYPAVDWFVGEDSVADESLNDDERSLLAAYLDGGGRLLISGSELGYDLVENGRDPAFYHTYLRAAYLGSDAGTYGFHGQTGGPFDGLVGSLDDGTGSTYDADSPDRLAPALGSAALLTYTGGTADAAAIGYAGNFRLFYAGFPLEAVADPEARTTLFCKAIDYLFQGEASTERLIDPGFEAGSSPSAWQVDSPGGHPVFYQRDDLPDYVAPSEGDWLAWLGVYAPGIATTTALTQVVALPSGEPTATLTLAWFSHPQSATPWPSDTLAVGVYDLSGTLQSTLLTISNHPPTQTLGVTIAESPTWQTEQLDLSAFAGQTLQLAFHAASSDTAFFVDDLSLATTGPAGPPEYRALWVDAYHDGIKSHKQIDELVETAEAGSFNALVVQVRRRGDTYYPSAIDPWAADADPTFDALAYLIERAHAAGIEVHAWATTLAIWDRDAPPASPDHAFNLHGPGAEGRDYWLMTSHDDREQVSDKSYYLDPGHPDAAAYTVAICAELAAKYDLDGLHLDRTRYPGPDWGYNPVSLARFQAQTGRNDLPDPTDAQWLQWRRDQVTALVRRIYLTVTAINPRLRVSAAVSAVGSAPAGDAGWEKSAPYVQHLQDWRGWLQEGILDVANPMIYRDEDGDAGSFDAWIDWAKDHRYQRGIVAGTGLYLNDLPDGLAQWVRVRQPSASGNTPLGLCGYSYASPCEEDASHRAFANAAVTEIFTQTAPTPSLSWKDTPTLGHLMGTLTPTLPCLPSLDGLTLSLTGPQSRVLATDGNGWFGAVDLPPGDYLLASETLTADLAIELPMKIVAGAVAQEQVVLAGCSPTLRRIYLPVVLKRTGP
jgi:uncharacterized lipoprotein YddW (UPF0748 family)